jgi:hypothetical protein
MIQRFQKPVLILISLVAAILTLSRPALATWPHEPNVNVPVCTEAINQQDALIVSDGDGGAILSWTDTRNGIDHNIYAQRIDSHGIPVWTADGVAVIDTALTQWFHAMASDGQGGAVIVWEDRRYQSSGDIFAQRVSPTGTLLWGTNSVRVCTNGGGQGMAAITSDGTGGAIVAWVDWRAGSNDIYAQRISAAGAPLWTPDGVIVSDAVNNQYYPVVVPDGKKGAIVAWVDERNIGNRDIYIAGVDSSGTPYWTPDGYAICTETGHQDEPVIIPDGTGGAIVSWQDARPAYGIYAQRVDQTGFVTWNYQGVAACASAGGAAYFPAMVTDGAGGAIITWYDLRNGNPDIYARRINSGGIAQWTANGVAVCTAAGDQMFPEVSSDGAGGAVIVWEDRAGNDGDISAQRVSAAGQTLWASNGVAVSSAAFKQWEPVLCSDGGEGAVVGWNDTRNGYSDIYAQGVEGFGYLGDPSPAIAGCRDVPNDQGGKVKLSWDASYLDTDPSQVVDHYWIFRSVPPHQAAQAIGLGLGLARSGFGEQRFFTTTHGSETYYWELVDSVQALHVIEGYSYLAATEGDSTANNNDPTHFMVMALNAADTEYWASEPDSGYSVDNLPPAAPQQFTGEYLAGSTVLHWIPNGEPDLAGYRLYRGQSPDFVPGPGNLVIAQSDTGYVDTAGGPYFYKLSAVDVNGNESPYVFVQPTGTVSADPSLPTRFSLHPCAPNPIRHRAMIRFDLPVATEVRLVIYDIRGRVVCQGLKGERMPAGRHEWIWDGRDRSGVRVSPGVYFVGFDTPPFAQTRRAVVLE